MFNVGFTHLKEIKEYRDTLTYDKRKLEKFISSMHDNKIRVIGRGLWYISAAHTEADIDHAIDQTTRVLSSL
jgi:glutamate-1-semialdehyde 2,1-aminomutase